jgi:hypothetical protein
MAKRSSSPSVFASVSAPTLTLPLAHARARWLHRQGLAAPRSGPPAALIGKSGWPRTLGGIDVYLATRARIAGLRRADLDAAVQSGALNVTPAVRGCIYVVPRPELPLVLRIAEEMWRPRTERELDKAGSSWKEVETLAAAIEKTLARGPMTPDALRKALPPGAVRSLGEAGKKIGLSSPLPVALRQLEFAGRVTRRLEGGRLDSERYLWQLPERNPLAGANLPKDAAARFVALAHIFFEHAAPATAKEFAEWSGLPLREAQKAVAALELVPVRIEGHADAAWAFAEDLPPPDTSSAISMLPCEDNYLTLHGGPAALVDPVHRVKAALRWGASGKAPLGEARHISLRAILKGAELIGFWEFDPDAQKVVTATFAVVDKRALKQQVDELAGFLRDELGHGKSFSLDTDQKVRERAALVAGL